MWVGTGAFGGTSNIDPTVMLVLDQRPSLMDVSVRLKRVRTRLVFEPNLERWCCCCSELVALQRHPAPHAGRQDAGRRPETEEAGPPSSAHPRADARSPPRAGAGRITRPINFTVGSTGSRSTGLCLSGTGEKQEEHDAARFHPLAQQTERSDWIAAPRQIKARSAVKTDRGNQRCRD